ncbi:unnamed protein product [Miscanthus lutarioriparius]|uniref:Uncharacterized protein n=1 Tax=Miscanthus lutarioriparius TaxID=422564 RepID=A0A811S768_9POAL|nr:unnamed protein product [Miscanthus lutarioriparius]
MASNGSSSTVVGEMQSSLDRVRRQLSSTSTRHLLQGPLLKRSDTLRKWNERWVILDPTTGKIEYKYCNCRVVFLFAKEAILELHRKRNTFFEQKLPALQEHGYPLYKKALLNYRTHNGKSRNFLRAHKEAVNSLGENGPAKLGTVATVVAVANATAIEATKEVEAAMKISLRATLGSTTNKLTKGQLDDLTIMMETLRVKDDELHQLLQDIRARDSTINEIEEKLQETAEAAETAASAARSIDEERRFFTSELERFA